MQLPCVSLAAPLFDRETHRSSIPTNCPCGAGRSAGQEPALGLRPEGRPPSRRTACFALHGREHRDNRVAVAMAVQLLSE